MSLCAQLVGREAIYLPTGPVRTFSADEPARRVAAAAAPLIPELTHNMLILQQQNQIKVLKAIAAGSTTTPAVAQLTSLSRSGVRGLVKTLEAAKLVITTTGRPPYSYQLTPAGKLKASQS